MKENNSDFQKFLQGMGVLTESLFLFYSGLLKAGFSEELAADLVKHYLTSMMEVMANGAQGD